MFALLVFVAPMTTLLAGMFLVKFNHTPSLARVNMGLTYLIVGLVPLCGFGIITFVVLGSLEKQRRVFWQGIFGLCVNVMLFFVKAALGIWLLNHV